MEIELKQLRKLEPRMNLLLLAGEARLEGAELTVMLPSRGVTGALMMH